MIVIAVDGTAASGKGTVAHKLAAHYDLAHLDTGGLYRLVGLMLLRAGRDPQSEEAAVAAARALDLSALSSPDLRTTKTGQVASVVAAIPAVRAALVDYQRDFARLPPPLADGRPAKGSVLDGRDIGTVICPNADVKIFCDAAPQTRAHRRFLELGGGKSAGAPSLPQVLADISERDARDRSRQSAPLKRAEDAYLLDSTNLSIEATFEAACDIVNSALKAKSKATLRP